MSGRLLSSPLQFAVTSVFLLFSAGYAVAAPVFGEVSRGEKPVSVTVNFTNQYTGKRYSVKSDRSGRYKTELPTGAYDIESPNGSTEPKEMLVLELPVRQDVLIR